MKKLFTDKLAELLETKSRDEQAAKVERLIALAQAPVLDLVIRADTRTGQVTLYTVGNVPLQAAYAMLDEARKLLVEEERKAVSKQTADDRPQMTDEGKQP